MEFFIWVIVFFVGYFLIDWETLGNNDHQSKAIKKIEKTQKPSPKPITKIKDKKPSIKSDLVNKKACPEQRKLIGEPFHFQCKEEVFTSHEIEILRTYGEWLRALASRKAKPKTPEQEKFVEECQEFRKLKLNEMLIFFENKKEYNLTQATWFKYICRLKFERENPALTDSSAHVDWGWQGPPEVPNTSIYR